jgi:hypothetical protein
MFTLLAIAFLVSTGAFVTFFLYLGYLQMGIDKAEAAEKAEKVAARAAALAAAPAQAR